MALAAAHFVIIPVKTEEAQEDATIETMSTIEDVRSPQGWNPNLEIWGVLPNQFDNTLHHRDILGMLQDDYKDLVYKEPSKRTTLYNEALSGRKDIALIDKALGEYWDRVAESVIKRGESGV